MIRTHKHSVVKLQERAAGRMGPKFSMKVPRGLPKS